MRVKIVKKMYDKKVVLKLVNMQFNKGDISCVIGKSGCGKSTLLNIIGKSDKNYIGHVDDHSVSLVAQTTHLLENLTLRENIELNLSDNSLIEGYAKQLGILEILDQKAKKLSGGQRQRGCILRALVLKSDFILLDEPTSSLDKENIKKLLILLKNIIKTTNTGIILSTHESYVIEDCDVVYKYNNYNFDLISEIKPINRFKKQNKKNIGVTIFRTFSKYFISYFLSKVLYYLLFVIILLVSVLLLKSFDKYTSSVYDLNYNSMSDQLISVEKSERIYNCEIKNNCNKTTDFSDITFSDQEIKEIEKIDGVKEVVKSSTAIESRNVDSGFKSVDINISPDFYYSKDLEYLQEVRRNIVSNGGDTKESLFVETSEIAYHFTGVTAKPEYIELFGNQSVYYPLANMVYGDYDFKNKNDIVIPLHLGYYYADQLDVPIEDLVSKEVEIDVMSNDNIESTEKFKIIGIYSEENILEFSSLGNIYTSYNMDSESLYQSYCTSYCENDKFTSLYPTMDQFVFNNKTSTQMVVIKTNPDNIDYVEKELLKLYPEKEITSKNIYKRNNYRDLKLKLQIHKYCLIMMTLGVLFYMNKLVCKLFYKSVKNDIVVFESVGYTKNQIKAFYTCNCVVIYLVLFLVVWLVFFKISICILLIDLLCLCHVFKNIKI